MTSVAMATRTLIAKLAFSPISSLRILRPSFLLRLRPLSANPFLRLPISAASSGGASFSTRPATSSLNDPSPNWSNRPPKETILLDGCDFEHWLVVLEPPEPTLTRDEIIDSYIKTLTEVVGSEEEAKKSIYSVSTKHYFAFGCIVSEELSYKIKTLPKVRWVLPDSYLDVKNKDYGGEPFIDGKAVPYDPKYHEEWVRNNARANERPRRNDRPRNFDRSRNFERRRENTQNFQNREAPPMPNQGFQASVPPQNATSPPPPMPNQGFQASTPPQNATPPPPPNVAYQNQMPNSNSQGSAHGYQGVNQGYQGGVNQGNQGGNQGYQGGNQGYQGGGQGYQARNPGGSMPGGSGYQANNSYQGGGPGYQGGGPAFGDNNFQRGGAPSYQGGGAGPGPVYGQTGGPSSYQGGAGPNYQAGGAGSQGSPNYRADGPDYQGRDLPGRDQ